MKNSLSGKLMKRLAVLSFVLVVAGILLYLSFGKIGPLVQIDPRTGQKKLFGGSIVIQPQAGQLNIGGANITADDEYQRFTGEKVVSLPKETKAYISFVDGKIRLINSSSDKLSWSCNLSLKGKGKVSEEEGRINLDLTKARIVHCEVNVPLFLSLEVEGENGEVVVEGPHYPVQIQLKNGQVEIEPDAKIAYVYRLNAPNGRVDSFLSSTEKGALVISVDLESGNIRKH